MSKFIPVEPEKWAEMVKAQAEVARLKAEVERLTKAGDDLAFLACFHYDHGDISKDKHSVAILDAWENAKGVQS